MKICIALPSAFLAVATSSFALNPGDIAFTGFNADGNDNLSFVVLAPVSSGTQIHFTDNEWTGSAFNTGESGFTWTASGDIAAGSIVTIDNISATVTSNLGTVSFFDSSNKGVSNSDEIIYAYQGTTSAPTVFLTALANDQLTTGGAVLPSGLVVGSNAIEFFSVDADMDIAAYTGTRACQASFSGYLSSINNPANWITQDASGDQQADGTQPDLPFSTERIHHPSSRPDLDRSGHLCPGGPLQSARSASQCSAERQPAVPGGLRRDLQLGHR